MTKPTSPKHMALGVAMSDFYGVHPNAWRTGGTDPKAYLNIHKQIEHAQKAERGGLDFIFMPDRVFLHRGFGEAMIFPLDPIVQLSAIDAATKRIGLIGSMATSFHEPYTIARQLRALDLISNGRVGWNVVPILSRKPLPITASLCLIAPKNTNACTKWYKSPKRCERAGDLKRASRMLKQAYLWTKATSSRLTCRANTLARVGQYKHRRRHKDSL